MIEAIKAKFASRKKAKTTKLEQVSSMKQHSIGSVLSNGDYDIAQQEINYDTGVETTADEDLESLDVARDTCRLKVKNNGFAKGVLQCATDYVIGTGLTAKSTLNRRKLSHLSEEKIKSLEDIFDDYFNEWALSQNSDITGVNNFYLQQRLAYFTYKRDGECFASTPVVKGEISLKLIGAEFIRGGVDSFRFGIETDTNNKPKAYSVSVRNGEYVVITNSSIKKNMIHLFKRERIDAIRGMPALTEIMVDLDFINSYMKVELDAARNAALLFGSIETESRDDIFAKTPTQMDLSRSIETNGVVEATKKNFRSSQITQLGIGEKLNIHSQGRDNPNFDKIVNTAMQKVSSCLRIPVEIFMTVFTSSYSASRAAMLLMDKFVAPERILINKNFNTPIRDQVITWGVLSGALDVPDFSRYKAAYLQCEWTGEAIGSVDPVKDAKAKIALIEANLTTRTRATKDLGQGDFETNIKQIEKEKSLLQQAQLIEDDQ